MAVRNRARDLRSFITGTYWNLNVGMTHGAAAVGIREWCADVVGERFHDNPLALKRWEVYVPRLNGKLVDPGTGVTLKEFSNYPVDFQPDPENSRAPFVYVMPPIGLPPEDFDIADRLTLARSLLAQTNPSAPHMGYPSFVGELRDLPSLVESWGKTLLKRVATGYVVWRWVVKPMLSDINKLCQFVEQTEKRMLMIETLLKKSLVRRNVTLRRNSTITERDLAIQSNGAVLSATRRVTYTEKVWGSIRWRLVEPSSPYNRELWTNYRERLLLAKRLTFGLTSYEALATAWELMPWSWFVDWFGHVGEFIAATNNTLGCDVSSICLMRTTTSRSEYAIKVKPDWVSVIGEGSEFESYKGRYPVEPWLIQVAPPMFFLPILTGRQWSILGALAVLRAPVKVPRRKLRKHFQWTHLSDGRRALLQWSTPMPLGKR